MSFYIPPGMATKRQRYINWVVNAHKSSNEDENDPTYLAEIRGDALVEFNQLASNHTTGLYNMLEGLDADKTFLRDRANALSLYFHERCRRWDRTHPEDQQSVRDELNQRWQFVRALHQGLSTRWATEIENCRAFSQQYSLDISQLQESMGHHSDKHDALWDDFEAQGFLNPHQLEGKKVNGEPVIQQQMRDLADRQVLPPPPSVKPQRNVDPLQALPANEGRTWKLSRTIGSGNMGQAVLYEQTDDKGNLYQRTVVKDSFPDEDDRDWKRARKWHGDITQPEWLDSCVPLEWHTQRLASQSQQWNHVVKVWDTPHIDTDKKTFRIYMEYAPNGNLQEVIEEHQRRMEPVPEKFLWLTFQSLLRNCMVMKQGDLQSPKPIWSEIVHCDIKPENVFLGMPESNYYRQYPTPKLGDFGLAFVTNANDATNPSFWWQRGTEGFFAPEQCCFINDVTEEPVNQDKMLSPCNVYGSAVVIFALMMIDKVTDSASQPTFIPGQPPERYTLNTLATALYSAPLRNLVMQCLATGPNNRPNLQSILQFVDSELQSERFMNERNGQVDPDGDTLLLPRVVTALKWASRIAGRVENVNRRPRRLRGASDSDDEDEDEEMQDA